MIAVNVPKVEIVGSGEEDAVIENSPLDETVILDNAESDKMAEIVKIDDAVFIGNEETVDILEYDDTEVPVASALVEKVSRLVFVIVVTPLDVLDTV